MGDSETLTEVPATLKRLAKYIVRGFYGLEHALTLDVLIRYPCVKEEDIGTLLQFDKKQLRTVINTLKADKFIKCRMRVETGANGKSTRHNYYYINYKVLVDVVKYKLDHVRRKIESDERDSTTRASFKCPSCLKTYSDLEVNQLFDPFTELFRCTYCSTEVEEDSSSLPKRDARTLIAKFNDQMEPIFALLRETEDIVLPSDLLEPQPTEIPELALSSNQLSGSPLRELASRAEKWANKNSSANMYVQNVVISVRESDQKKKEKEKAKEQPVWMTRSTIQEVPTDAQNTGLSLEMPAVMDENDNKDTAEDNEVIRTLMMHELKPSGLGPLPAAASTRSDTGSDTSESEDEKKQVKEPLGKPTVGDEVKEEEEEEEQETEDPTVMVAGQPHLYSEVSQNPQLVSFMTEEERDLYIKVGQQMFQSAFE
ncbi:general transcription factor IIE subunit 1-like isoform X1 [Pleurodeles waltl]|uniref:general transcription factor IIE subunit 1-like isoform X1 n=1 Tax=Pleurodeles waltl TaxID=8319 RepID=UPI0037095C9C